MTKRDEMRRSIRFQIPSIGVSGTCVYEIGIVRAVEMLETERLIPLLGREGFTIMAHIVRAVNYWQPDLSYAL